MEEFLKLVRCLFCCDEPDPVVMRCEYTAIPHNTQHPKKHFTSCREKLPHHLFPPPPWPSNSLLPPSQSFQSPNTKLPPIVISTVPPTIKPNCVNRTSSIAAATSRESVTSEQQRLAPSSSSAPQRCPPPPPPPVSGIKPETSIPSSSPAIHQEEPRDSIKFPPFNYRRAIDTTRSIDEFVKRSLLDRSQSPKSITPQISSVIQGSSTQNPSPTASPSVKYVTKPQQESVKRSLLDPQEKNHSPKSIIAPPSPQNPSPRPSPASNDRKPTDQNPSTKASPSVNYVKKVPETCTSSTPILEPLNSSVNQRNSIQNLSLKSSPASNDSTRNQYPSTTASPSMKYVMKSPQVLAPSLGSTPVQTSFKPLPLLSLGSLLPPGKTKYVEVPRVQSPLYSIPQHIKKSIENNIAPQVLKKRLTSSTYKDAFAALLYAEDFYIEVIVQKISLSDGNILGESNTSISVTVLAKKKLSTPALSEKNTRKW